MGNKKSSHISEKQKLELKRHKYISRRLEKAVHVTRPEDVTLVTSMGQVLNSSNPECKDEAACGSNDHTTKTLLGRTFSMDEVDANAATIDPMDYEFPFENLVFEGGGNKGLSYCGGIRYLEQIGLLSKVKRIAGASAGAMTAALLAAGYSSYEIEDFLGQNINDLFLDHKCGYCSLLPNLLRGYGWNPGNKIYDWFGTKLEAKLGKADITFQELWLKADKELCVIVTNLNQMSTLYCHAKTTPDMPVRLALRMSMAIPGMFEATKYTLHGQTDVFVDGGILCNYPIHCFDGWYLSLHPNDSFIKRLQPLKDIPRLYDKKERFGKFNEKTLGFLLFADNERDVLRFKLEKRRGVLEPAVPEKETKLYKQKFNNKKCQEKAEQEHRLVVQAVDAFLKVLNKHNREDVNIIDSEELKNAFKDTKEFSRSQAELLFGEDVTVEKAFEILDQDSNGKIMYYELVRFIEQNGISLQSRYLGYERKDVNSFFTFLDSLQSTLLTNVKKIFVEDRDALRTVGINTGHVGTSDFVLQEEDKDFVVARGYNSTRAFFQYYAIENNLTKRPRTDGSAPIVPTFNTTERTDTAETTELLASE